MNLEPQHNEAMRKEIGYRLGVWLSAKQGRVPERLLKLVRQLVEADHDLLDQDAPGERIDVWLRALFLGSKQHLQEVLRDEPDQHKRDECERLLTDIDDTLSREFGVQPRA